MIQELVLNCGRVRPKGYFALEAMANRYGVYKFENTNQYSLFDGTVSKDIRLSFRNIGEDPFTPQQVKYGALDVILPLKINKLQELKLKKEKLAREARFQNEFISTVLANMEYTGFYIDPDVVLKTEMYYTRFAHRVERLLDKYIDSCAPDFKGIN